MISRVIRDIWWPRNKSILTGTDYSSRFNANQDYMKMPAGCCLQLYDALYAFDKQNFIVHEQQTFHILASISIGTRGSLNLLEKRETADFHANSYFCEYNTKNERFGRKLLYVACICKTVFWIFCLHFNIIHPVQFCTFKLLIKRINIRSLLTIITSFSILHYKACILYFRLQVDTL